MEKTQIEKVCMLAGKILLTSGAETYRVEDTMSRIARSYGLPNAQCYATPTAINFSIDKDAEMKLIRITRRSTADLRKITDVNSISRQIADGKLSIREALHELEVVEKGEIYPAWLQVIIAILTSGSFTVMFGGSWDDLVPAAIAGGIGFAGMIMVDRLLDIRFLAESFGAALIGFISYFFIQYGIGQSLDLVIIGAVMPLVPGLLITNAVRDLLAGHLIAGISKGVEALLTAVAIGAGVATVFAIM